MLFILSSFLPIDLTIRFEQNTYFVSEGNTVEVCLILSGSTEVNVSVNINIEEGTASAYFKALQNFVLHLYIVFVQVRVITLLRYPS